MELSKMLVVRLQNLDIQGRTWFHFCNLTSDF